MKQQAAVIPFRGAGRRLEICLIRKKRSKKRWGIPKGFVDRGDTPRETALKEAREEAGLRGRLVGSPTGTYKYRKFGATLEVLVYVMRVTDEDDDWDEADIRERCWVPYGKALKLLDRHPGRPLIAGARAKLP